MQEKLLPHPLAPLLKPLRMARRTEAAGAAGKHQEVFRMAVGTADPGKPTARVAAVQIFFDDVLNDGPEKAILSLEPALVFGQEALEMVEQYPVEDSSVEARRDKLKTIPFL
jgi:hypothetical protein